jgi:DNA mismatch repair protein MutS
MAVKESGEEVTFLRKLIRGAASTSYGIYCARIAGLPNGIIDRAYVLLSSLEEQAEAMATQTNLGKAGPTYAETAATAVVQEKPVQMSIFGTEESTNVRKKSDAKAEWLAEQIQSADLMSMTPLQAMNFLYEMKQKISKS